MSALQAEGVQPPPCKIVSLFGIWGLPTPKQDRISSSPQCSQRLVCENFQYPFNKTLLVEFFYNVESWKLCFPPKHLVKIEKQDNVSIVVFIDISKFHFCMNFWQFRHTNITWNWKNGGPLKNSISSQEERPTPSPTNSKSKIFQLCQFYEIC